MTHSYQGYSKKDISEGKQLFDVITTDRRNTRRYKHRKNFDNREKAIFKEMKKDTKNTFKNETIIHFH